MKKINLGDWFFLMRMTKKGDLKVYHKNKKKQLIECPVLMVAEVISDKKILLSNHYETFLVTLRKDGKWRKPYSQKRFFYKLSCEITIDELLRSHKYLEKQR